MKKQTSKRLYAVIAALFMYISTTSAQIIYTDVNPDSLVSCVAVMGAPCSKIYNVDMNNDGTIDYILRTGAWKNSTSWCNSYVSVTCLDSNLVWSSYTVPLIADDLDSNKIIQNNNNWNDSTAYLRNGNGSTSLYWIPNTYKYLGIKFKTGSNFYYGWIRLTASSFVYCPSPNTGASFRISGYAYNSISNQPIMAGEVNCTTPTVTVSASGPLSFCGGDSVTLMTNGTGYKYQWKKDGVNIIGATKQTYAAKTAGVYKCKVTNSCGSITSGGKTITVPCRLTNEVFTEQLESPYELKIAPNPLSNSTSISFTVEQSEKISLKIVDLNGRLVSTLADKTFEASENKIEWSAADVKAGVYFLQFQTNETIQTEKLIITK
jgi:hypothetical protein